MNGRFLYFSIPIFKVILFLSFVIVCFFPTILIFNFDFIAFDEKSLFTQVIYQCGIALAVIGALLMTFKILPSYDFNAVYIKQVISIGAIQGSFIGMGLLLCCAGLAYLSGNVSFSLGNITSPMFLGYLIYYLFVSIFEELLFRSFPLCVFSERYHIAMAIILTSVLFGLAHISNENVNGLALLNITLAGILFAAYTLEKNNISWAIGLHFGWNFMQGTILGYQVSGTNSPGILKAKPMG